MPIKIGSMSLKSRVYVPPMAGVTDIVFRDIVRRVDPECMLATEMVSSRALMNRPETRIMDLAPNERPIGIQIFGHEPDIMAKAAIMAEEKGADFVDINMGCPVPKITKGKDGCALMREPDLAKEIVTTVRSVIKIPLTVKFRLGWDDTTRNCVEFGEMLEESGVSAVTVHGRTRQQLYSGKADWSFIAKVKRALSIPVFGNGDVFEPEDAFRLLETTGCDGVAVAARNVRKSLADRPNNEVFGDRYFRRTAQRHRTSDLRIPALRRAYTLQRSAYRHRTNHVAISPITPKAS